MKNLLYTVIGVGLSVSAYGQALISAKDAGAHINEKVVINDKIFGGKHFTTSGITLLDVGGTHPKELLTLLIKADDRKKFTTAPEVAFKDKMVTIVGTVIDYKGKPEIIITDTTQIKVN